jgi:methylase of polypeptide subunit release factors
VLGFRDDQDYDRAFDVFRNADFTEPGIRKAIGRDEILKAPLRDIVHALRNTRGLSSLETLIRLFFLGVPVPVEAARRAVAPMGLETWIEGRLIAPADAQGQLLSRIQVWPVHDLILAVDLPWRRSSSPPPDFVVPPGLLTLEMANAMIRNPCGRMLDLGTGSGLLALLAAPLAAEVTATDKNERAVAFTRFNARLNRIGNVRCLQGDLFEPVGQERFQLVLCNPPFVISPEQRYLFRDSGERGDVFCQRLVRSGVDHLEIGGFFQLTANIAHHADRPWKSDLEAWFAGLGCDVLVLVERTEDASDYAMSWILSTEPKDNASLSQLYDIWMDFFERERIEALSYVLIVLRRSARDRTWLQIDDPPCQIVGPCGEDLFRFFECRDRYDNSNAMERLGSRPLRISPQIRIEQEYAVTPGGLEVSRIWVHKTGGLRYPLRIDDRVGRLIAGCDGVRTLGQLLQQMAHDMNVNPERASSVLFPVIRSLIERGVLLAEDPCEADERRGP